VTGGPGAKGAPPFTDEELAAIGEYLPELRRSVAGQRILYTSLRDRLRGWPDRPCRWLPVQIVGDDGASWTAGRPALCAWLGTVDRGRRGRVRPDLSGGKTASNHAGARCLRGSAGRYGPSRKRPGAEGRRSADGEVTVLSQRLEPAGADQRAGQVEERLLPTSSEHRRGRSPAALMSYGEIGLACWLEGSLGGGFGLLELTTRHGLGEAPPLASIQPPLRPLEHSNALLTSYPVPSTAHAPGASHRRPRVLTAPPRRHSG
jgi:hypothetical protein